MKARVAISSGRPGELSASYTIGGASLGSVELADLRCSRFSWHSSHSPLNPGDAPQAHLRWSSPVVAGVRAMPAVLRAGATACSFTLTVSPFIAASHSFAHRLWQDRVAAIAERLDLRTARERVRVVLQNDDALHGSAVGVEQHDSAFQKARGIGKGTHRF